jgi:hypothetical protein
VIHGSIIHIVTRRCAGCSRNCGSKGKKMHKRRKLKRKRRNKRECQSGRQINTKKIENFD